MTYQVGGKEFEDWTAAQDAAVQLLNDGVDYVRILQWDDERKTWGLLQELNLERGIMPNPNFGTTTPVSYTHLTLPTKA